MTYFLREGVDPDPEVAAVLLHAADEPLVGQCLPRPRHTGFGIWEMASFARPLLLQVSLHLALCSPTVACARQGLRLRCVPFGCRQAQDACYLGQYGPERQLRARRRYSGGLCLAGVGGVYTSCCVPFFRRQAQEALHHGRSRPEGQVCSAEDRDDSTFAAHRVATTGLMVQTAQKTVWRWRHSFCPYSPASRPKKVRPRSSLTTCSWLVLLVTLHFALCSFSCRQAPSSSTTVTRAWLVLLVTMHISLCSPCFSAGPRYSASWLVWKWRTSMQ